MESRQMAALGIGLIFVGGMAWGAYHWVQTREERKLYTILEPHFTSETNRAWENLPLASRLKTGRQALPALEALQATPWVITITDLRANGEEDTREAVFRLEAGDTELLDCTVPSPAGDPAGSCSRFRHVVPSGEPRVQDVPVALHLGERPFAESLAAQRLNLGTDAGIQIEGTVRIDEKDMTVRDPVLLLPSPRDPEQMDRISVASFSPRTELALSSIESYPLDVSFPMPSLLSFYFGGEDRLKVFYAEVATSVDLTAATPVYRFEGMLEVMNQPRGRAILEYQPKHYIAAAVTDVSIPVALSSVCLNIDQALVEFDFVQHRLRVAGSTRNGSVESFACRQEGSGDAMDPFTRLSLGVALRTANATFNLPPEWISQGQVVLDLDDEILCGDLAVQGSSLFHAAYFGNQSTFRMWAPLDLLENDIRPDRTVGSMVDLAVGAFTADWSFPSTNPRQCWDGDDGPKIDLERTILAGWRQEPEDNPSPFPVMPAAAVQ